MRRAALLLPPCFVLVSCAEAPSYMRTAGEVGDRQAVLGWILLVIASLVVLLVAVLVLLGAMRRGRSPGSGDERSLVARTGSGLPWILWGGIVFPAIALTVTFALTLRTLSAVGAPEGEPAVTIEIIGHRWWWEVRYRGASPSEITPTANEIHIPVGEPVRLELLSSDVIHSFWVPQLGGKTDLIPGQRNVTWLQANAVGRYWGQCGEYCGLQHAHMQLAVIVQPPDEFRQWLERQHQPARDPADSAAVYGREVFTRGACALCHTIRGTSARGQIGPDLTHIASRRTLAAGVLDNTRGNLAGWIAGPQAVKPGTAMPAVALSPGQLHAVVAYLESLR